MERAVASKTNKNGLGVHKGCAMTDCRGMGQPFFFPSLLSLHVDSSFLLPTFRSFSSSSQLDHTLLTNTHSPSPPTDSLILSLSLSLSLYTTESIYTPPSFSLSHSLIHVSTMNSVKSSMKMNSPLPKDLAGEIKNKPIFKSDTWRSACLVLKEKEKLCCLTHVCHFSFSLPGECKRASKILNSFIGKSVCTVSSHYYRYH